MAVRLAAPNGRILAVLNDGRGLADNWTSAVVISDNTNVARSMNENSCQVFEDQAFVAWLDDTSGAAATRVYFNRYDQDTEQWFSSPVQVDDSTYPVGSDVRDFQMVVKRGTSGSPYVVILAHVRAGGQDHVLVTVSPDAGATFNAPFSASAGLPGSVGAVGCDLRFGELHLAWTDDRSGSPDLYYRRAILGFSGNVVLPEPEVPINTAPVADAPTRIVLQTNAEFGFSGTDQKYVGVAYLEDDGGGMANLRVATSRDNGASFSDVVIDQTTGSGVDVAAFDFEITGDTFTLIWQDDSDGGEQQCHRSTSDDGLVFEDPIMISAFEDPTAEGLRPRISPSSGTPDGACVVFVEVDSTSIQVRSNFSDQFFAGGFHDEEYPGVSTLFEQPGRLLLDADVSYNELYYNYITAWRQETSQGTGVFELVLGGFRPPQVVVEQTGSKLEFEIFHVPFQDTFGFVMLSMTPPTSGDGLLLYDGRRTGLVSDALTSLWLTNRWQFAIFENSAANEGGATQPFLLPPMATPLDLTVMALSWGPFGELHTLSEPFTETIGPVTGKIRSHSAP